LAGLGNLKAWLHLRRAPFLGQTKGKDRPRGVLLLGVQGGGKSLATKANAGRFGLPLLRMDFAALYDKFYGETERNLRRALQTAEVMAPCVLWLDEIEKGLASPCRWSWTARSPSCAPGPKGAPSRPTGPLWNGLCRQGAPPSVCQNDPPAPRTAGTQGLTAPT
jgi:hypothetical protein